MTCGPLASRFHEGEERGRQKWLEDAAIDAAPSSPDARVEPSGFSSRG